MPFMNSGNVRYGVGSPGPGWVYAGKAVSPNYKAQGGLVSSWKKAPAPAQAAAPAPTPAPAPPPPPPAAPAPTTLPTSTYTPPAGPSMADVASQFSSQIAEMQQGFQQSLAQQASQFAAMQQAQEERMLTLQEQMKQAAAAAAARPTVAGVKTATSSAGTDMQIARRGTTGGFSRAGMRIKSLNV